MSLKPYRQSTMFALVIFVVVLLATVALLWKDAHRQILHRQVHAGLDLISQAASERLDFRFAKLSDKDFFVAMASDPSAAEANGWSGNEAAAVRARFTSRQIFRKLRGSELVAVERVTGHRVATATFASNSTVSDNALSIGLHVRPDHRRKGYGRETMAAAILILQQDPTNQVIVGTRSTNLGMQRIMEQLGYEPNERSPGYKAPNGETYDAVWYECDASAGPPQGLYTN